MPLADAFHNWRRKVKPAFASLMIRGAGSLPLLTNRALGSSVGHIMALVRGKSFQISLENIQIAFPNKTKAQQIALAKRSVIETAKTVFETTTIWRKPFNKLQHHILSVENLELLTQPAPNGLILLAPHLGNWEFLGPFLAQHVDITIIYQSSGIEEMDNLIIEGRCRDGVKLAPANRKGVVLVAKALKGGNSVGILPDQVPEKDSGRVAAKAFGKPAWTMNLVHKLIARTGCTAIMGYAKRVPGGFHLKFSKPNELLFSENEVESVIGLNRSVENCVYELPEQYQWEYKRYKRFRDCEREKEIDTLMEQ